MMLATPVRSSAWSSTTSTVERPAVWMTSADHMDLCGQRCRFPGEHDLRPAARRRDDGERGADALGTLLHARHAEARRRRVARNPAPIVGNREAKAERANGRRANRDPARAWVLARIRQRFLRDADDLALDDVAVARQRIERGLDRDAGRELRELGDALERHADFLTVADVRPERADGPPRFDHVLAGEVD